MIKNDVIFLWFQDILKTHSQSLFNWFISAGVFFFFWCYRKGNIDLNITSMYIYDLTTKTEIQVY